MQFVFLQVQPDFFLLPDVASDSSSYLARWFMMLSPSESCSSSSCSSSQVRAWLCGLSKHEKERMECVQIWWCV
jgi:hypothetical protein